MPPNKSVKAAVLNQALIPRVRIPNGVKLDQRIMIVAGEPRKIPNLVGNQKRLGKRCQKTGELPLLGHIIPGRPLHRSDAMHRELGKRKNALLVAFPLMPTRTAVHGAKSTFALSAGVAYRKEMHNISA